MSMASFNLKLHELSEIFPLMNDNEFGSLKKDIQNNGLFEPIKLYEEKILDGRNRYNACRELDIEPSFSDYVGQDPLAYVISENLRRRNLTPFSRVEAVLKLEPIYVAKGREKKIESGKKYGERHPKGEEVYQNSDKPLIDTLQELAELADVSRDTVARVKHIINSKYFTEKMREKLRRGETLINSVYLNILREERGVIETIPLPEGKYNVIYSDPPWKYGDKLIEGYGAAEHHYTSMTIQELCDLDIKSIVGDNAVLFLWVTSPLLEECFSVIKAWGFEYSASFVWDKIKHNWGHYNSVRHEFLLICIKGSFPKQNKELHDSVISIERSEEHSEKPEYFRDEIIEKMYPRGKWIELFARYDKGKREELEKRGWTLWGAQV